MSVRPHWDRGHRHGFAVKRGAPVGAELPCPGSSVTRIVWTSSKAAGTVTFAQARPLPPTVKVAPGTARPADAMNQS